MHSNRYYGFYSKKTRGMRKKAAAEKTQDANPSNRDDASNTPPARCSQTWAMLIKRVYETDSLSCPKCGSEMAVVSFIDPPQKEVINKILEHCGLRRSPEARPPPDDDGLPHELDYVDFDTFLATF